MRYLYIDVIWKHLISFLIIEVLILGISTFYVKQVEYVEGDYDEEFEFEDYGRTTKGYGLDDDDDDDSKILIDVCVFYLF